MSRQKRLTTNMRAVLSYVTEHYDQHGYSPTIREIGNAVGIDSTSVVNYNLRALVDAGQLNHVFRGARTYVPVSRKPLAESLKTARALRETQRAVRLDQADADAVFHQAILDALPARHRRIYDILVGAAKGLSSAAIAAAGDMRRVSVEVMLDQMRGVGLIRSAEGRVDGVAQLVYYAVHLSTVDRCEEEAS